LNEIPVDRLRVEIATRTAHLLVSVPCAGWPALSNRGGS